MKKRILDLHDSEALFKKSFVFCRQTIEGVVSFSTSQCYGMLHIFLNFTCRERK